jgi:5'-nucleotidase
MAKKLTGVDVIIGGDSHTLLGENLARFGLNPQGPYPTQTKDKRGDPVCIAQAWQYSLALGELSVSFNAEGQIETCTGTPHILLGETFQQNSKPLEGEPLDEVLKMITSSAELSIVPPDLETSNVLANYAQKVEEQKKIVIGQAAENLCLERIPGQGRSQICDVRSTSAHGSDIAQIVALAFKNQSIGSDIGIQNAGGVRMDLPAGSITISTVYALLPFANTLVNLKVTGAELAAVLEDAVDYAISAKGSSGAYPYASGLRWNVDISKPKGQRLSNVEVKLKAAREWTPIELERTYTVVTSNYLASGKDGYTAFAPIFANPSKIEDTYLEYAQSFVDYVKSVGSLSKLPESEYSTQKFYDANGKLQNE